uniref:Uncharacterized protein n=1 Tax=viral metagenome TaxID=1070528 RepID=A0A6C0JWS2_9ZZZZ
MSSCPATRYISDFVDGDDYELDTTCSTDNIVRPSNPAGLEDRVSQLEKQVLQLTQTVEQQAETISKQHNLLCEKIRLLWFAVDNS